ncbi:MAG: DUF1064 domain-containing protein [Sarcina sp.]
MKRNKYGAKKTVVNNIRFDSLKEANRYKQLVAMTLSGEIKDLELQVRFEVIPKQPKFKERATTYIADFVYWEESSKKWITEDVKGMKTDVYKIKKKLFLLKYGDLYEFREV